MMSVENWPLSIPGPGEVRIKTKFVGICGSDIHGYLGTTGRRIAPMVMGHELSGTVSSIGKEVKGIKLNERVTVQPIINCGYCNYCKEGAINICPNREFLGVMQKNGALQEEFCVPAKNICVLPDNIGFEVGALIEPFAVAYRAVKQAHPVKNKTIMVCGSGTIGLMVLKVLKLHKAAKVIMIDLSDERLTLAMQHGADLSINPMKESIDERLEAEGIRQSINITFEAVGVTATVHQTIQYVKNKGLIVWVGNSDPMISLNMQQVVTRELHIQGTYVYTDEDFRDSIKLISENNIDFTGIISKKVGLFEAAAIFDVLSMGAGSLIKVLVDVSR
jgi:2-desacetyl-2-hydroxyethyl bacteriochlorophyllide A dehydrogenase